MKPITVYVNNHVRLEKINTPQHWQGLEELAERESGYSMSTGVPPCENRPFVQP